MAEDTLCLALPKNIKEPEDMNDLSSLNDVPYIGLSRESSQMITDDVKTVMQKLNYSPTLVHRYNRSGSWGTLCCWGGHLARTPPAFPLPHVLPAHAPCHGGAPMKPSASLSTGKSRGHAGPRALPLVLRAPPTTTAHGAAAGRQGSAVQRPEMDIPFTRCRKNTRGPGVKHAVQDFLGCMFSHR